MSEKDSIIAASVLVGDKMRISRYLRSRKKRTTDLVLGLIGILILFAIFPPIAIAIKLNSRGPIFYRQRRVGIDNSVFDIIKFRTMVDDAERYVGPVWREEGDARVTEIGMLLRKLYIDELPQCFNVIRGEMSIVGPRPERPELVTMISARYPGFARRTAAHPGITGVAQVKYPYVNTIEDSRRKLTLDEIYIRNASLAFDVWIVIRTFVRVITRRGS